MIGVGTVKMQPVGQAIIGDSSRRVLADIDHQRRGRNQENDPEDDIEETGSEHTSEKCPADRSDRGGNLQKHANAQIGQAIANIRCCRAADRKSTRLNSSHQIISYAVFCLKKKKKITSTKPCVSDS